MLYELIIETRQPACGGKSPTVVEFLELEIADPVAFVQSREPGLELIRETGPDGDLILRVDTDKHQVKYQFTEA